MEPSTRQAPWDVSALVTDVLYGSDTVAARPQGPLTMTHLVPTHMRKDVDGLGLSSISKAFDKDRAATTAVAAGVTTAAGGAGYARHQTARIARAPQADREHLASLKAIRDAEIAHGKEAAETLAARRRQWRAVGRERGLINQFGRMKGSGAFDYTPGKVLPRDPDGTPRRTPTAGVLRDKATGGQLGALRAHEKWLAGVAHPTSREGVRTAEAMVGASARRVAEADTRIWAAQRHPASVKVIAEAKRLRTKGRLAAVGGLALAAGGVLAAERGRSRVNVPEPRPIRPARAAAVDARIAESKAAGDRYRAMGRQ